MPGEKTKTKRIFLTGFMTSGKSTIGRIMANVFGWNFFDLDKVIESNEGKKITEIFEEEGEAAFRKIESETLRNIAHEENIIVALGGGAIVNEENLNFCKNNGTVVYLKVDKKELLRRLKKKVDRPLFKNLVLNEASDEKILERINTLLKEREKYYLQADIVFETGINPVGKTVDDLTRTIKRYFREKNRSKRPK